MKKGYIAEKGIQLESLDDETRRLIWDIFYIFTKQNSEENYRTARIMSRSKAGFGMSYSEFENANPERDYDLDSFRNKLESFIKHEEWYKVLDIIELFSSIYEFLIQDFNKIFENEKVGYRLSGIGEIIEITNNEELLEINNTQELPRLSKNHFLNAITEFGKRKSSNHKIVARESIDGLEALLRDILRDEKIILGKAINKLQVNSKYEKYHFLFEGLDKIWAFANDQVRHAEKNEESIIGFHDAKFILVLASSIANYIQSIR